MIQLLMILSGTAMYTIGQLHNKVFKYLMGVPIALLGMAFLGPWMPLLAILTYFIACEVGYGDNNPLTRIVGKRWAIVIHGRLVGLAALPIIGIWCVLSGVVSGITFWFIAELDDSEIVKEPWVAILRGIAGTICLLLA